jgi:Domain of unknown function (DUF4398)
MHRSVRNGFILAAAVGLFSMAGCASESARPTAELSRASTLIDQAEKAGAQRYAAADLDRARDELKQANGAADDGKQQEARYRAGEAAADAELALARADSAEAQHAATQIQEGNEALQNEANRDAASPTGQP